jgi:hypothetical protein
LWPDCRISVLYPSGPVPDPTGKAGFRGNSARSRGVERATAFGRATSSAPGMKDRTFTTSPRCFGGSPAIWLRLQVAYDIACAKAELASKIEAEVTPARLNISG